MRRAMPAGILLFASSGIAAALSPSEPFHLFPPPRSHYFEEAPPREEFVLDVARPLGGGEAEPRLGGGGATPEEGLAAAPFAVAPKIAAPSRTWPTLITIGVIAGSAVSSLDVGHERHSFHFGNEEWFGEGTYAGGADKASHFVFYNGLSRELAVTYGRYGYSRNQSTLMAFATAAAAGLLVEIGDGLTVFGFAWEDFAMDTLGAGTAAVMTRYGLDDTMGFRFGKMTADQPPPCCRTPGVGKDYSQEIYTADLKLAGFARRLNLRPGPARFLLLSATYGSKGYRYSEPSFRQRQIGVELGINFPEILTAIGVSDQKWWGRALYMIFNFVRIPYTAIGFRYDLNHHRWDGPDAGNDYDPGP